MFKKAFWVSLGLVLTIGLWGSSLSFAQSSGGSSTNTEKLTIVTYYPSPFGVYNELRAKRMAIGSVYYDPSKYCWSGGSCLFDIDNATDLIVEGSVGIGMYNPAYKVDVHGTIHADGADLAENILAEDDVEPGDLVMISEKNDAMVKKTESPYELKVAGVISENPGLCIGSNNGKNYRALALAGRVLCKVTTVNGPIKRGDLLVSSSKPGYAMKAVFVPLETVKTLSELKTALEKNEKRRMAVIGKALEELKVGEGKILILLNR